MPLPEDRSTLLRLIEERLKDSRPAVEPGPALLGGVAPESAALVRQFYPSSPVAAAVLIPIVDHLDGLSVLLTQRSTHLKNHAGQISFPGGRIEPGESAVEAALRESYEEIGLPPEHVQIVGFLEPQLIITGFWVTPVVGFVRPGFELKLDAREVAATFEVPLLHVLDQANHLSRERRIGDATVAVYDIPFREHRIWGATAGMLMVLYRLLTSTHD